MSPSPPVAAEPAATLVARCRFPDPSEGPVDLAVSGGPDSLALAVLARAAGLSGRVHHVDHGLRDGSGAEAGVVEAVARNLGFDFVGHRVSVPPGPDLEARARRARYGVLPAGVLTGHTMDDQAETVLLNLLRGAALDGVAAMSPGTPATGSPPTAGPARGFPSGRQGRPPVRRPILGLRRYETVQVCAGAGLRPVADPTNDDPRFRRNRVRAEVLPLLCDVAGRDVVPVLARQADLVADDVALLEALAAPVDPTDVAALRSSPLPLARRTLRRWLRDDEHHPPSGAELARVMAVVAGERVACEIGGGRRVGRRAGRLFLQPASRDATKAR